MTVHCRLNKEARTANIGLAIWWLKCCYELPTGFGMQGLTAGILLNYSDKKTPYRQAEKRYVASKTTL